MTTIPSRFKEFRTDNWVTSKDLLARLKPEIHDHLMEEHPVTNLDDFEEQIIRNENNFIYTIKHISGENSSRLLSPIQNLGHIIVAEGYKLCQVNGKDGLYYIWYHRAQLNFFYKF